MADFCRQCTIRYFGEEYADRNDMRGLSTPQDDLSELYPVVLCEGCGCIQVDSKGVCLHHDHPENE